MTADKDPRGVLFDLFSHFSRPTFIFKQRHRVFTNSIRNDIPSSASDQKFKPALEIWVYH